MPHTYARYDSLAANYDKVIQPLERWFLNGLRKEAIASLPVGSRVLEIGAGTGQNFILYERNMHGVATEPSAEMLRIATNKERPKDWNIVQSCAEELPFKAQTFDGALATLVICSVKSPEQVFAELRRVVRPGGTISLLEHVRPALPLGWFFDLLNLITVPLFDDHVNRRTVKLVSKAGFKVTKVRRLGLGIFNVITCVV